MIYDRLEKVGSAKLLPVQWNKLTDCYFQQKEFLYHTDIYNSCGQRYYLLWNDDELVAGACVYTLRLHLFTFSGIPSLIKTRVIGIPASVSSAGVISRSVKSIEKLVQYIIENEKGLLLVLNTTLNLQLKSCIEMTMMPTVVMERAFDSWTDYLDNLRSPYRRRANRILNSFQQVKEITTGCQAYTKMHYDLYLQIMNHTNEKLETLSFDFFKNLPDCFHLSSYFHKEQLICWHITCRDKEKLFFFFGGHDYTLLNEYQSYFNNLFGIVRQFADEEYQKLDLGQTAEIAKMKTGARLEARAMFLHHHNSFVRLLIRCFKPFITYHPPKLVVHPFKKIQIVHRTKTDFHENIIRKAATIT
jgi:hypothetical protein